jgi:hypothetical protein
MATITFNGPAKTITIGYDGPVTNVNASEIYSDWKDWVSAGNAQHLPAFAESVGGNELGPGVSLAGYYFLRNDYGWRIVPENGYDFTLQMFGDLYPQDPNVEYVSPPAGDYTVTVTFQRSAASYVTVTGGGGGGTVDPVQVADAVWGRPMTTYTTVGTFGDRVRRLLWRSNM